MNKAMCSLQRATQIIRYFSDECKLQSRMIIDLDCFLLQQHHYVQRLQ